MSWVVGILCGSKELAERVSQQLESGAMQFNDYIHVIREVNDDEASVPLTPFGERAEATQAILHDWPTEDQKRLYRLLYNAGIRINR